MVGGVFSSLIDDYIPKQKEKRLIDFIVSLQDSLSDVHKLINEEYIKTEEFSYLFENCLKSASENYQQETLELISA